VKRLITVRMRSGQTEAEWLTANAIKPPPIAPFQTRYVMGTDNLYARTLDDRDPRVTCRPFYPDWHWYDRQDRVWKRTYNEDPW
jgi:hypothetical protein